MLAIAGAAAFAFVVHRWVSDELERERKLSRAAATAVAAVAVLMTLLVVLASAGGVADVGAPALLRFGLGGPLAIAGAALAIAAWRALGSRERALAMRTDRTITTGPYRFSRHPLYVGWTICLLGIAVAGGSALAIGLVLLMAVALLRIARGEERWLSEELGPAYSRYCSAAPALLGRPRSQAADGNYAS